ncbi:MAG: HAD family hydrolase [Candidatus Kapaibacterium sp.]
MSFSMKNKAVYFDRDGIVNVRLIDDYVRYPDEFRIIPEAAELIKYLKEKSFYVILITNQQGIGKKLMTIEDLDKIHEFMQQELNKSVSYKFDDIYFCPDLEESGSFRRKPNPGMILEAAEKWNIDNNVSFMIGDSDTDIVAGKSAGTKTIFIGTKKSPSNPDYHFTTLKELINNRSAVFEDSENA